jgi:serine/threonine protein kinase
MIGRAISHYRVLETLGAGGMGVVYLAEDGRLGRQVALKFLPPEASRDETTLERFRLEARAASSLSHPGICTVFDIGDDGGSPFIVMEALKGETLRDRIKRAPITVSDVLDLAIQLADALEAAHSQGIVHRDIKPGNIFVGEKNRVKILDFGLAKLVQPPNATATLSADDQLTVPGSTLGTVSYMSPEQARGEEVDARSDLFSLGTVIYEMAAGVQAFGGSSPGAVIAAILIRQAAPIIERNGAIPPRLEEIIQKALEKDRDLRYQHAADLLTDLKRLRRDMEVSSSHSSATVLATRPGQVPIAAASRASVAKAAPGSRASVAPADGIAPASLAPASLAPASLAPPSQAGRAPAWRYGLGAGAAVVLVALGLAWAWRPRAETPAPAPQAGSSQAGPSALAPAPGPVAAQPPPVEAAAPSRSSVQPPAAASAAPATPPPQTAIAVRTAPPAAATSSQSAAPAPTSATRVASAAPAETPAPAPQLAPAVSAPVLSNVPLTNAPVPAPPPSAPAPRTALPAPAPTAPPTAAESDDAAIRRALATYALAVEKKDVSLFRSVRPGLSAAEEGRLRDSFKQIESQQVTLDVEEIRVEGRAATVRLSRKDTLVVGGRRQTQNSRQVLRLEKAGADWIISEFH